MAPAAAQVRDAVAVIQYLLWLEKTVPQGQVDEFSGAQHIDALRRSVLPPRPPQPGAGQPGTPSISLPAVSQGAGAQPRAQLREHLGQRAQRGAGPLQVRLSHGRGRGAGAGSSSGERAALTPPPPCSPSNGSSRKLSVDEMYLADTGGQYLCVDLNVDPPALCRTPRLLPLLPAQGGGRGPPKPALGAASLPLHPLPSQGRDDRHHADGALGCPHPTPEGTSPHHASQHPLCAQHRGPGQGWMCRGVPGAATLSPRAVPLPGSLYPRPDGQHRPGPPRLPVRHGRWVLSRASHPGLPGSPRGGGEEGRGAPLRPPGPHPACHSPGRTVESFARRALWEVGLNYGHGTGHGIGNFLSVHECRCRGTSAGGTG